MDCVGCGHCCMTAPCGAWTKAIERVYEHDDAWVCPELVFEDGRHWCRLVKEAKDVNLLDQLAIGAGCCSGLNSWRREPIRDRRSEPKSFWHLLLR